MGQCKQLAYILMLVAALAACDSKGLRGARCRATTDCNNGLFCDNGSCKSCPAGLVGCGNITTSCSTSADCGSGKVCFLAQCFSSCGGDAECDSGLVCTDKRCVAGCRADNECESKEICEQKACKLGCRADTACDTKQICETQACVLGCRNDAACEARQVCDNKTCVTGCRNDAACTAGAELCLSGQCVGVEEAMKPTITFTPASAVAYVGENVQLSTAVSVAPGPNDTASPVVTYENISNAITVNGFTFTLNSTSLAGTFSFTVKAKGRAGTRSATFQFQVITDTIYGYVVPLNQTPTDTPGLWQLQSDGNGFIELDREDSNELMKRGIEYGFSNRPGQTPAYSVGIGAVGTAGYARDYEIRTNMASAWLRTTGITDQGICAPGLRAPSGALGGTGAKTCMYPITNMSSDNTGRRVAFMIAKADLDSQKINPIGDTIVQSGAVMVLDTTAASAGTPVVLGDALNSSPMDPQTTIPGVTVFSRMPERTLSGAGEVAATARNQLAGPSISADGSRLAVTHTVLPSCPSNGDCGQNYSCNNFPTSDGVCERTFCQNDSQCRGCETRRTCVNDIDCTGVVDVNGTGTQGGSCETYGAVKLCRSAALTCSNDFECARNYAMSDPSLSTAGNLCQTVSGVTGCFCATTADCGTGRTCVAVTGTTAKICSGPVPTVMTLGTQAYSCQGVGAGPGTYPGSCDGCVARATCECRANTPPCNSATEQAIGAVCCKFAACTGGAGCQLVSGTTSDYACACKSHQTEGMDVSRGVGVPVCCASGRCVAPPCESTADCKVGQICTDHACVAAAQDMRLEIFDSAQPGAPVVTGPNLVVPSLQEGAPGFLVPVLYPTLMQTDRVAYFAIPILGSIGALSGSGSLSPSTHLFEVRLTTSALDPASSILVSPRHLGGVSDSGLLGMSFTDAPDTSTRLQACLDECNMGDHSACSCSSSQEPACIDGDVSCCKANCFKGCETAISGLVAPFGQTGPSGSQQPVFTVECQNVVQSGAAAIGSSMPMWTARDNTGSRLLIVEQSSQIGIVGYTGGTCTSAGLTKRFCGTPPPAAGPSGPWAAFAAPASTPSTKRTRLVLHDIGTNSSLDLLDTPAFNAFLLTQDAFEIGDPHMISEGRQVAFAARGEAIKPPEGGGPPTKDDPSVFVVNTDGTNPRRVLDRNRAVAFTVPGYGGVFSCASCAACESPTLCNPDSGSCSAASPEVQAQQIGAQWLSLFLVAGIVRRVMRWTRRRI